MVNKKVKIGVCLILLITIGTVIYFFNTEENNNILITNYKNVITSMYGDKIINDTIGFNNTNVTIKVPVNKSSTHFMGSASSNWVLTVKTLDELTVSYSYIINDNGSTDFTITPIVINQKKVDELDYTFKVNINLSSSIKEVAKELEKKDLENQIRFSIPKDVKNFTLMIGKNTTIIQAITESDSTKYDNMENLCKTSDGIIHAVWEGLSDDLYYGNSSNAGNSWGNLLISTTGSVRWTGIVCDSNDNLFIYYNDVTDTSILLGINSTDGGVTWNTAFNIYDASSAIDEYACVSGSDNIKHCCISEDAELFYINSSNWGTPTVVNSNQGDSTDTCDIEVDGDNYPYIISAGTDQKDLDLWSTRLNGWGDANRIRIRDGGIYPLGDPVDLAIREVNGVQVLLTCDLIGGDLTACNFNDSVTADSAVCTSLSLDDYTGCNVGLTDVGNMFVVGTYNSDIDLYNNTKGTNEWDKLEIVPNVGGFVSIIDSNFPLSSRLNGSAGLLEGITTSSSPQTIFFNYTFSKDHLPPHNITGCLTIDQAGIYYMNESISNFADDCIIITASDVVFDCKGFTIDGTFTYGSNNIFVHSETEELTNVFIQNCVLTDSGVGIEFDDVDNSFIINNTITEQRSIGIGLIGSSNNNNISNNSIYNIKFYANSAGISMAHQNNYITGGVVSNNTIGILLSGYITDNTIIQDVIIKNNNIGLDINHASGDNSRIYNNFFNNTLNVDLTALPSDYFNTTYSTNNNIMGDAGYGGNYWANMSGEGYSETCTVSVTDYICDNPVYASNGTECIGCTGYNVDELPLSLKTTTPVDTTYPSFSNVIDNNGTLVDSGTVWVNATVENTNGTVGVEFDGTNYSMDNFSNVYNVSFVIGSSGVYTYYVWAYGNGTSNLFNKTVTYDYTINATVVVDNNYPSFTNPSEFPSDPSEYNDGGAYQFNITIGSTNGTGGIAFDDVNYSMINVTDNFYKDFLDLGVGVYNYYYWAYGNGTSMWYNSSEAYSYTINKNDSFGLGLTATTPITYGTTTDFVGSNCPSVLSCILNISNAVYSAGSVSANYSTEGNANYSANSTVFTVTINQAVPEGSLASTEGWTIDYAVGTTISLTESNTGDADLTYIIYRDGVSVGTGETINLSVGTYNYILNTTGGINYTSNASMDTETLTINQIPSKTSLVFNVASPQVYGTSITPTCSIVNGVGTPVLKQDGTVITSGNPILLGANTYSFNCTLVGSTNYTSSDNSSDYTITQAVPEGTISGTTPISVGTAGDVTGSESNTGDVDVTYTLYRNNTLVSNPDTTKLTAGSYSYIYNTSGGTNYTFNVSMDTFTLVVDQIASEVNLTVNNTDSNITITQGSTIDLNATLITGDFGENILLYNDGVLINEGTSPIGNTTTFNTAGFFNITAMYLNTGNYTQSVETWWVNVTSLDNEYPLFTNIDDNNGSLIGSGTVLINVTITSTNGTAGVDFDGTNYTMSNISSIYNASFPIASAGTYTYYIWAYGNGSDNNFNKTNNQNYTINSTVIDNNYPLFYNKSDNSGTLIDSGNVTISIYINATNGTAWVQFDGTNYSMTNVSNFYNTTFEINTAGTFNYFIGAYGNGTSNNENTTQTYSYTILGSESPYIFSVYSNTMTNRLFGVRRNEVIEIKNDTTIGGELTVNNDATATWFRGLFNWVIGDDWNYFDGHTLVFNESKLATVFYNITSINVMTGTQQGVLGDIQTYNNIPLNVSEVNSDLELRVNFSIGVGGSFNNLIIRYKSVQEDEAHTMVVQIYENESAHWEDYGTLTGNSVYQIVNYGVFDSDEHVDADGIVRVRIYQNEGVPPKTHKHNFDWITISKGYGTPTGEEIDPHCIYKDGTSEISANIDFNNYNISTGSINSSDIIIRNTGCTGLCNQGAITWNTTHICVCTTTNNWKGSIFE